MILSGTVNSQMFIAAMLGIPGGEYMLSTTGGDIEYARAISDIVNGKTVTAAGGVSSAGVPVFASAARRLALPSTVFLWHMPYLTDDAALRRDDLVLHGRSLDRWYSWACTLLARRTERSAGFWSELGAKAGTEFTANDALQFGLVDRIVLQPPDSFLQLLKAAHYAASGEGDSGEDDS